VVSEHVEALAVLADEGGVEDVLALVVAAPTTPDGRCGFLNLMRPASGRGLTAMIRPPPCLVRSSADSMRGWLVPGFWPRMMTRSARCTSSRVTLPLPMPIVSVSATPLDSWHMLEQSGMLFVPKRLTRSW
jgi:hypothetical protein